MASLYQHATYRANSAHEVECVWHVLNRIYCYTLIRYKDYMPSGFGAHWKLKGNDYYCNSIWFT